MALTTSAGPGQGPDILATTRIPNAIRRVEENWLIALSGGSSTGRRAGLDARRRRNELEVAPGDAAQHRALVPGRHCRSDGVGAGVTAEGPVARVFRFKVYGTRVSSVAVHDDHAVILKCI